jgi:hypothetical protein
VCRRTFSAIHYLKHLHPLVIRVLTAVFVTFGPYRKKAVPKREGVPSWVRRPKQLPVALYVHRPKATEGRAWAAGCKGNPATDTRPRADSEEAVGVTARARTEERKDRTSQGDPSPMP